MSLSKEHKEKLAAGRKAYQEKRRVEKEEARRAAELEYDSSDEPRGRVFRRRAQGKAADAEILNFPSEKSIEVVIKAAVAQLNAAERLLSASRSLLESLENKDKGPKSASG
jgi:hypothetical protein